LSIAVQSVSNSGADHFYAIRDLFVHSFPTSMHIPESVHNYLVTFGVERETRAGRFSENLAYQPSHGDDTASANLVT
jgi:hypothetical protein